MEHFIALQQGDSRGNPISCSLAPQSHTGYCFWTDSTVHLSVLEAVLQAVGCFDQPILWFPSTNQWPDRDAQPGHGDGPPAHHLSESLQSVLASPVVEYGHNSLPVESIGLFLSTAGTHRHTGAFPQVKFKAQMALLWDNIGYQRSVC